jgi:integrase
MEVRIETIADLVDAITVEMERLNYKPSIIGQFRVVWAKLVQHSGQVAVDDFTVEHGMEFLEDVLRIRSNPVREATSHRWMRAIYLLSDFKRTGVVTHRRPWREFEFVGAAAAAFGAYVGAMSTKGLSASYIRNSSLYLERFARFLDHTGLDDIGDLSPEHVHGFVESLSVYELATIYNTVGTLRRVLGFLHDQGMLAQDLSAFVPRIHYSRRARVPSAYSRGEVERLIGAIDRGSPRGKRDLALILLAARLGLRAGDIAGLRFGDLKWERDVIEIVQHKTGRVLVLPMLNDVGEAIIDYLRNARPHSETDYVFLKLHAPLASEVSSDTVCRWVLTPLRHGLGRRWWSPPTPPLRAPELRSGRALLCGFPVRQAEVRHPF